MIVLDDIPPDLVITITDVRRRHCVAGARTWLKTHNFDYRDAIKNGLNAREMFAVGDLYSYKIVEDTMKHKGII